MKILPGQYPRNIGGRRGGGVGQWWYNNINILTYDHLLEWCLGHVLVSM